MRRPPTGVLRMTVGLVAALWASGAAQPVCAGDGPDAEGVPDVPLMLDTAGEGVAVPLTELGEGPYVVAPIFTR